MADAPTNPNEKNGYDPKGTATPTHDLRLRKDEAGYEEMLRPLGEEVEEIVKIPRSEYESLTRFRDMEILGLESAQTEISVEELQKIQDVALTEATEALLAQKEEDLRKAADAEKATAVKKALEDEKNKKKKDPKKVQKIVRWINIGLAMVGAFVLGYVARKAVIVYKPTPPGQSTMELTEQGKDYAMHILQNARSEIVWVTQHADDKVILDRITERRGRGPIKALIIAGSESQDTAKAAAEDANITCFVSPVQLGPTNFIIVDRTFILDCTSQIAVIPIKDPTAAAALYHWADQNLGTDAALVYKEKARPKDE